MLQQEYEQYTEEDFRVWKILFERQIINLQETVAVKFLEGLEKINFSSERIPNFKETNLLLERLTGWHIQAVPGIIPDKDFFELLGQKKFPATCWLRKFSQLDYLEEPDMFHDVFGHIPLLTDESYCDFLLGLSAIALKYLDKPEVIELMSRLYWFTIEFGLIQEKGVSKIYGAGIISSSGETKYSLSDKPVHLPFDVVSILQTSFYKDHLQEKYFVVTSFEELYHCLPLLEMEIETFVKEKNTLIN
jgi:phenylalanine-4-hydroxylase